MRPRSSPLPACRSSAYAAHHSMNASVSRPSEAAPGNNSRGFARALALNTAYQPTLRRSEATRASAEVRIWASSAKILGEAPAASAALNSDPARCASRRA